MKLCPFLATKFQLHYRRRPKKMSRHERWPSADLPTQIKKRKMHKLASKRRARFLFLLICDRLSLSMGTVVWLVKIAIKCPCQANIVRAFIFLDQQRNGLRNRRERDRQLSFPLVMVVALCGVAVVVAGCLVCVEKCSFVLFSSSSSSSVLLCFTTGGYILHPAI